MAGVEEKNVALLDEPPVIGPGQTFDSVTDTITDVVLKRPIGLGWLAGLAVGMTPAGHPGHGRHLPVPARRRHLGHRHPGGLGLRHHQLRVVDRYRPRGHADLGHSAAVQADVAQLDQPVRRGDDAVRRGLRRHVPAAAHGPSVAGLLDVPVSQQRWACGRSSAVRWCGTCSRFRRTRRFRRCSGLWDWFRTLPPCAKRRRIRWARKVYGVLSLGWRGSARHWTRYEALYILLAGISTPLVLSVHTVVSFDFAVAIMPGMAHHNLPAVLCGGRDLLRICHGAGAGDSDPQVLRTGRHDHRCATCRTRRRSCWRPD